MSETAGRWLRIWSLPVRLLHWSLAGCVAIAWLTPHGPSWLHDGAGYAVLGLIGARIVIGVLGQRSERFSSFAFDWRKTLDYAHRMFAGREPRYLGHNPLGSWMIFSLLATSLAAGVSGWLYTTDRFWGVAWVEAVHGRFADLLLVLVGCHVAGVLVTSIRQGENLVAAMIHGRKPRTTRRHPEDAVPVGDP